MDTGIKIGNFFSFLPSIQNSVQGFFQNEQFKRIQEFVIALLAKLSSYFSSFNTQSKEINVKPIAMIGFLSLVGLIVFSIFRESDANFITPLKPRKHS